MAEALVKRLDSAHMKHLYETALETTDADFLASTSEVTLEQVRRLRLESESKDKMPPKMQNRPPQPPKQTIQPKFALNTIDILLDGEDAESWLVATPFADEQRSQCLTSSGYEEKKEVVGSPVESSISSEVSRGGCVTPASILDAKLSLSQKGSDTLDGFRGALSRIAEPGKHVRQKERDIRNLPRNTGCITHTPASTPAVETTAILRPPKSKTKTKIPDELQDNEKTSLKKSLSSKLRGRISSITQKDAVNTSSSSTATKERPKSIGPVRRNRLMMSAPVPRPKSSLGRAASEITKSVPKHSGLRKKSSPSPHPASLARPASSLATVREEDREGKRYLGLRKTSPAPRPKSSPGRPKMEKKMTARMSVSRIASPALRPKSSLSGLKTIADQTTTKKQTGVVSRITRPASVAKPKTENKESRNLLGFKRTTSSLSLAPTGTKTVSKGDVRSRRKAVGK